MKTVNWFFAPMMPVLRTIGLFALLFATLEVTHVYAQNLTLLSVTPGSGGVNSVIEVTAVGFQQGVVSPPLTVTLTPLVGSPVLIPATAPGTGIGRSISFTLPVGVVSGVYAISVSGGPYVSSNTLPFSVVVPAFSLNPVTGGRGATITVDITGLNTSFANPTFARFGPGIQVGGAAADTLGPVQLISPTVVRATLTIAADATLGGRTVQILSLDNITQANAFTVTAPTPLTLLTITPGSAGVNAAIDVTASGFQSGVASPTMTVTLTPLVGAAVQVPATAPGTGVARSINFVVPAGLVPGLYAVSAGGGGYQSVNTLPFTAVVPAFTLNPVTGGRATTLAVDITGVNTTFSSPAFARFGPGIQVGGAAADMLGPVQVISPTLLRATLTIAAGATLGGHTVQVVSLDDITQPNAFVVTGLPQIISVAPNSAQQGQTRTVVIAGENTVFTTESTVSFGSGITINSVAFNSATSLAANITVAAGATLGVRDVTVTTNGTPLTGVGLFTVTSGSQSITSINPPSSQRGKSVVVTVTGSNTNFSGSSSVSFGPDIAVTSITIGSLTSLTVSLNIAPNATLGARDVSVTTSGTTVTGAGLFSVLESEQSGPLSCTANAGVPPLLRAEGFTELTGDLLIVCTGGVAGETSAINLQLFLNTPITSRVIGGQSEALLIVDELAGSAAAVYRAIPAQGDNNSVVWANVQFSAPGVGSQRVLRIANVRANATSVGSSTTLVPGQVVAFVSASPSNSLPLSRPQQVVGYVQPGLRFDITNCNASGAAAGRFAQCSGENSTLPRDLINGANGDMQLALRFTEGFQTAFKTRVAPNQEPSVPGVVYNSESGFLRTPELPYAVGGADSGTRLIARFSNIPAGTRLFVTTGPSFGSTVGLNAVLIVQAQTG